MKSEPDKLPPIHPGEILHEEFILGDFWQAAEEVEKRKAIEASPIRPPDDWVSFGEKPCKYKLLEKQVCDGQQICVFSLRRYRKTSAICYDFLL